MEREGGGKVQFLQQLESSRHGFRRCTAAFRAAVFDALGFVGVVAEVVVVEFFNAS